VELARTGRLLLRRWEEHDLPAFFDLYSRDDVMRWLGHRRPRRALADPDEARERLRSWHVVAARLGMRDEGITQRWFGLTMRQFRYPADAGPA
jgi:hypothetical protein